SALSDAEQSLGVRHRSTRALLDCGHHLGLIRTDP
ncbi:MAG: hypothetical protein QOI16_1367, partial [Pseudonocardiales bacterium]|nr:hypothetical protein [Pseudonocardiales bacterium]